MSLNNNIPMVTVLLAALLVPTWLVPACHAQEPPEIRLERVIALDKRGGGKMAKFFRKLAEAPPPILLQRPYGVTWDGDDLLVTDPDGGRVARFNARGRLTAIQSRGFESPIGIAVCALAGTRTVVVADSRGGRVHLLGADLEPRGILAEGLERPTGVACAAGRVFVAETGRHRLLVFDAVNDEPEILGRRGDGAGEFNFPVSLAGAGDFLWIGDTLNFRVQRVDAVTGRDLGYFGRLGDAAGDMPRIKGLAVDPAGRLWISDAHLDLIALHGAEGTFLTTIGAPGRAAGEFSFPAGIAAHPDGRMAVVDSLNRRVQVFRLVEAK